MLNNRSWKTFGEQKSYSTASLAGVDVRECYLYKRTYVLRD